MLWRRDKYPLFFPGLKSWIIQHIALSLFQLYSLDSVEYIKEWSKYECCIFYIQNAVICKLSTVPEFVHTFFLKTFLKVKLYGSWAIDLHVETEVPFLLLKKYIKTPIYGHQTKQLFQQLRYIHALIQPRVIVNVPATARANIVYNSDGYIRDGQRNS